MKQKHRLQKLHSEMLKVCMLNEIKRNEYMNEALRGLK